MLTNSVNSFTGAFPMSMAGHFVPILLLQKWVWQLWATNTIYVWFSKVVFFIFSLQPIHVLTSFSRRYIHWMSHSFVNKKTTTTRSKRYVISAGVRSTLPVDTQHTFHRGTHVLFIVSIIVSRGPGIEMIR